MRRGAIVLSIALVLVPAAAVPVAADPVAPPDVDPFCGHRIVPDPPEDAVECAEASADAIVVEVALEDGDIHVTFVENPYVGWDPVAEPAGDAAEMYNGIRRDVQDSEMCRTDLQDDPCDAIAGQLHLVVEITPGLRTGGGGSDGAEAPAAGTTPVAERSPTAARRALADAAATTAPSARSQAAAARAVTPVGPDRPDRTPLAVVAMLGLLGAAILYRRLTRDDILGHDLRSRLLEIVREEPGVSARDLARRLDVAPKTIHYHVRVLADAGLVVPRIRSGRKLLLARDAAPSPAAREALLALRQEGKDAILEALAGGRTLHLAEIGRRIDRHPSTVKRHADELVDRGVLVESRDEGRRRLRLADGIERTVARRAG